MNSEFCSFKVLIKILNGIEMNCISAKVSNDDK